MRRIYTSKTTFVQTLHKVPSLYINTSVVDLVVIRSILDDVRSFANFAVVASSLFVYNDDESEMKSLATPLERKIISTDEFTIIHNKNVEECKKRSINHFNN